MLTDKLKSDFIRFVQYLQHRGDFIQPRPLSDQPLNGIDLRLLCKRRAIWNKDEKSKKGETSSRGEEKRM